MKKLLLLPLLLIALSCSTEEEDCKCQGEFAIFGNQGGNSFFVSGVDCADGANFINQNSTFELSYIFLGCK